MLHNPDFPDHITQQDFTEDTRNVIDHYRYWTTEDIRSDLAMSALPIDIVAENFAHDFNIATLVRNANGFNVKGVHIVGRRQWDKRGSVGTHLYTPIHRHSQAEEYYQSLHEAGNPIIVMDNIEGAELLPPFVWPEGPISIVFGQESIGVSNLVLGYATHVVEIPQRGSVRSLNVGTSSGIVLYDYLTKMVH